MREKWYVRSETADGWVVGLAYDAKSRCLRVYAPWVHRERVGALVGLAFGVGCRWKVNRPRVRAVIRNVSAEVWRRGIERIEKGELGELRLEKTRSFRRLAR